MSPRSALARVAAPQTVEWAHHALTLRAPEVHHAGFAPERLGVILREAIAEAGLVAPAEHAHRFEPQGFSFVAFGPAVRVVLHTWPERGVATLDVHGPIAAAELRALLEAIGARTGWTVAEQHLIEPGGR